MAHTILKRRKELVSLLYVKFVMKNTLIGPHSAAYPTASTCILIKCFFSPPFPSSSSFISFSCLLFGLFYPFLGLFVLVVCYLHLYLRHNTYIVPNASRATCTLASPQEACWISSVLTLHVVLRYSLPSSLPTSFQHHPPFPLFLLSHSSWMV